MHSINFWIAHAWINIFEAEVYKVCDEKIPKFGLKKCQTMVFRGFLLNVWEICIRIHKYGFVLLNRLKILTIAIFSDSRITNLWKISKKWVSVKIQWIALKMRPPSHILLTEELILILSPFLAQNVAAQSWWRTPITYEKFFASLVPRAFQQYTTWMILYICNFQLLALLHLNLILFP